MLMILCPSSEGKVSTLKAAELSGLYFLVSFGDTRASDMRVKLLGAILKFDLKPLVIYFSILFSPFLSTEMQIWQWLSFNL